VFGQANATVEIELSKKQASQASKKSRKPIHKQTINIQIYMFNAEYKLKSSFVK